MCRASRRSGSAAASISATPNGSARVSLLHAFAQNDIAIVGETPTGGYNLLKVEISHTRELKNDPSGIKKITVGVVGNNLLNEDIRNSVSYTKDQVLMPGAGVRAVRKRQILSGESRNCTDRKRVNGMLTAACSLPAMRRLP